MFGLIDMKIHGYYKHIVGLCSSNISGKIHGHYNKITIKCSGKYLDKITDNINILLDYVRFD